MCVRYCADKFTVEPVDVIYEEGSEGVRHFGGAKEKGVFVGHETTPRLSTRQAEATVGARSKPNNWPSVHSLVLTWQGPPRPSSTHTHTPFVTR